MLLTQTEYGRRCGVTVSCVCIWVKEGHLKYPAVVELAGKWMIDPAEADRQRLARQQAKLAAPPRPRKQKPRTRRAAINPILRAHADREFAAVIEHMNGGSEP